MWLQLRRDPMMGITALVWGGVVALNAGVMTGLLTTLAAGSASRTVGSTGFEVILAALLWFPVSFFLLFGKARDRCHPFDLALPIPARRLWLIHVGALVLLSALYLAGSLGILWLLFWAFRNGPVDLLPLKQALAGLILPVLTSLILTVVLMQQSSAFRSRIPPSRRHMLYTILLWGSGFGLSLLLSRLPAAAALLPLGLVCYLGWRTCRVLPPTFLWSPGVADMDRDDSSAGTVSCASETSVKEWEREDRKGTVSGWQVNWFLIRLLCLNPARTRYASIFFIPYIFLWGILMSGFFDEAYNMELPQLAYSVLSGFLLLSYLPSQMPQLRFANSLPISRKRITAFLLLPPMVAFVAGLGTGTLGSVILQKSHLHLQFQKMGSSFLPPYPDKSAVVRIPSQYGRISWDGNLADVVAPWGESHPLWQYRLVPGSRITVYSPFSTPPGSSPRFVAFQIGRAIEAIYGTSIPYEEILDRYLEVSPDGTVASLHSERLLSDYPHLKPHGIIPLAPLLLFIIGIVYAVMATIYFRSWRARVPEARTKTVYFALAASAVAVTGAQVGLMVAGWMRPDVSAAFIKILFFDFVQALPAGALVVWVLSALLLLACFRQLQRELDRVEVLSSPAGGCSL